MGLILVSKLQREFSEKMHVKCLAQYLAEGECSLLGSALIVSSGKVGEGGV